MDQIQNGWDSFLAINRTLCTFFLWIWTFFQGGGVADEIWAFWIGGYGDQGPGKFFWSLFVKSASLKGILCLGKIPRGTGAGKNVALSKDFDYIVKSSKLKLGLNECMKMDEFFRGFSWLSPHFCVLFSIIVWIYKHIYNLVYWKKIQKKNNRRRRKKCKHLSPNLEEKQGLDRWWC